MALQGTIETFALPEVLRMLGAGAKTGCLQVSGDRGSGRVWIEGGKVVGAEASGAAEGAAEASVVFELLRYRSGAFTFGDDETNPSPAEPRAVDSLLADAEARLAEWREIEAVVPALAVGLTFADELPTDDVTIDGDRWKALVAVADGRSAAAIAAGLGLDELDACRCAKGLVDAGLVVVTEVLTSPSGPASVEVSGALAAAMDDHPVAEPVSYDLPSGSFNGSAAGALDMVPAADGTPGYVDQGPTDPPYATEQIGAAGLVDVAPAEPVVHTDQHHVEQTYADQPYADQPYADQPYADQPYADQSYRDTYATSGFGDPYGEPVVADSGFGGSEATNGSRSSARAELDAMASGFGLQDAVPEHERANGFEHGFASDPSEDPAFSFAAPDAVSEPNGGLYGSLPEGMGLGHGFDSPDFGPSAFDAAPAGHGLFSNDAPAQAAPVSVAGDQLFATGTSSFDADQDDAGDAAEVARQLANLSPKAARAVAAAARATTPEEREAALAEVTSEGDEPINRGLLLKFLSSVQS